MNRRPRLLTTIAVASATALMLAACGGGDDGAKANDKRPGADSGTSASASPSAGAGAGASASEVTGRPKVELPSDVDITFTPERSGDATKDAILKDNAEYVRALNAAIVAQNPRLPALEFYTEGEGAAASQQWVQAFKTAGWAVTGTVRYYDRQVDVTSKDRASLSYCGDESKGFSKVIKTGEVKKTKATKNSYIAYGVQVERNDQGVWELVKITSTRGADRCRP